MVGINNKRSDVRIILDVLRLARNGERKTRIMYGANLSYEMLGRYLDHLTVQELIQVDTARTYHLTAKGEDLLRDLERVVKVLEPEKPVAAFPHAKL